MKATNTKQGTVGGTLNRGVPGKAARKLLLWQKIVLGVLAVVLVLCAGVWLYARQAFFHAFASEGGRRQLEAALTGELHAVRPDATLQLTPAKVQGFSVEFPRVAVLNGAGRRLLDLRGSTFRVRPFPDAFSGHIYVDLKLVEAGGGSVELSASPSTGQLLSGEVGAGATLSVDATLHALNLAQILRLSEARPSAPGALLATDQINAKAEGQGSLTWTGSKLTAGNLHLSLSKIVLRLPVGKLALKFKPAAGDLEFSEAGWLLKVPVHFNTEKLGLTAVMSKKDLASPPNLEIAAPPAWEGLLARWLACKNPAYMNLQWRNGEWACRG